VAQGTFRDPEQEVTNAFGSGTGFIIDSSGLAVTNNHVVTGAGTLDVLVAGENQPRAARVVAASECADLALIDIDGDNYPYLEWSQAPLEPTVEVYAAGFPLGEPTYSATRGSINKVQADRATSWAFVASEIVHDANINPGNSGGPLVDKDGKVVGVNYAVDKEAGQNFAIAREEAQRVIEELKKGTDVRSIGVNGTAIYVDDSLSGIWVASVKSGSPADKARVRAGDFITSLEGIDLATDGSMLDYCKVLRGHQPTDTLSVEVLRFDESTVYEGQINGRELAKVTSFEQIGAANGEETTTTYSGYRTVQDDTDTIQVNIPNEWGEVDGSIWEVDGEPLGVQISAAPSLQRFNETYDEPGMIFIASRAVAQEYNENDLLALLDLSEDCTKTESAQPYEDELYTGLYDYYENCDGGTTEAVVLTFVPSNRAYVGLVAIQLTSEADYEALDQIVDSFQVIGTFTD
jgi:serine protease Do